MRNIVELNLGNEENEKFQELKNITANHPLEDSFLIEQGMVMFSDLIRRTRYNLKDIFTIEEMYFFIDVFNASIYYSSMSAKKYILMEISDVIHLDRLDVRWKVDGEKLISKVENLTEFESFVVITTIYKFWNNSSEYKDCLEKLFDK